MRPCIGRGIARLSVNTLELAGRFTVIFPVLFARVASLALLPSLHAIARSQKRSVVVVVLAKPCTGHPHSHKYCFFNTRATFLTLAKQSFLWTSCDTR